MKKKNKNLIIRNCMTVFFVLVALVFAFLAGKESLQMDETSSTDKAGGLSGTNSPSQTQTEPEPTAPEQVLGKAPQPGEKVIYLTFDDGPTENTVNILNVLDRYGVKATFFVLHSYDGCEKQIKEIHDRGHQVGLHTYSHLFSIYRSEETYFEDLGKISDLVYKATGMRTKLVRFPGGSSNTRSRKYKAGIMTDLAKALTDRGYVYCDWNADSFDASAVTVSVETIVTRSTEYIGQKDPVVLLMHDALAKKTTVEALPQVIEAYQKAGYRFDVLSTESFVVHHSIAN